MMSKLKKVITIFVLAILCGTSFLWLAGRPYKEHVSFHEFLKGAWFKVLNPSAKIGEMATSVKYPRKKIETRWFSIHSPVGWRVLNVDEKWDGIIRHNFLLLSGYHEYPDSKFPIYPFISFMKSNTGELEETKIVRATVNFFNEMKILDYNHITIGENIECSFKKYVGEKSINFESEKVLVNPEVNSITIFYKINNNGFYGVFWGFEKDEASFWKCLKSIQWKM
jgi:hypothetical protein